MRTPNLNYTILQGLAAPQRPDSRTNDRRNTMGRPPSDDGLQSFYDWLVQDEGVQPTTARVYRSFVRTVRAAVVEKGAADQATIDEVFAYFLETRPESYGNLRSAWSSLAVFVKRQGGVLPTPTELPKKTRARVRKEKEETETRGHSIPRDVARALHLLKLENIIPLKLLPHLRWAHVQGDPNVAYGTKIRVADPNSPNTFFMSSLEVMRILHQFAVPRADGLTALIPRTPGDVESSSYAELTAAIRRFEREG
jgi:hypothetical protein